MTIKHTIAETIPLAKAYQWIEQENAQIIDVRTPDEYVRSHIPGAINIPLGAIHPDGLPNTGKKLILQCNSGTRSAKALQQAKGYQGEIYELEGGIKAWEAAGKETIKNPHAPLPLNRQVQIIVGSAVLLGVLLGYFMHPAWYILSAFFGAGLLNAGLTGWCGLAKALGFMPWNKEKSLKTCRMKTSTDKKNTGCCN